MSWFQQNPAVDQGDKVGNNHLLQQSASLKEYDSQQNSIVLFLVVAETVVVKLRGGGDYIICEQPIMFKGHNPHSGFGGGDESFHRAFLSKLVLL